MITQMHFKHNYFGSIVIIRSFKYKKHFPQNANLNSKHWG